MSIYSLQSVLATFSKPDGRKRTVFNQAPIGGMSSKTLILIFLTLPFIEYAAIFNPYVFEMLGIAQAIVFFIIFLVFLMQLVFVMVWMNNKKVKKKISASWQNYFPQIDLGMLLSSGTTPYSDFFKYYAKLEKGMEDAELYSALQELFSRLQEENKELLEAISNDRSASKA